MIVYYVGIDKIQSTTYKNYIKSIRTQIQYAIRDGI